MSHIQMEKLKGYLDYRVSEQERIDIESHLGTCERCFDLYLNLMEEYTVDAKLPDSFTDNTVEKIIQSQVFIEKSTNSVSKTDTRKTIVHYALAAGLTIVLMLTGVFQDLVNLTNQESYQQGPSFTENLMSKTESWLNKIDEINKEEKGE